MVLAENVSDLPPAFERISSTSGFCTCLLSAPSGGQGTGPIPCSIESCHTDHVGGVASQVFKLHPELWQEESTQALRLILELKFPEIDLHTS